MELCIGCKPKHGHCVLGRVCLHTHSVYIFLQRIVYIFSSDELLSDYPSTACNIFRNSYYQLGDGSNERRGDDPNEMGDNMVPVDLGSDFNSIDVEAGQSHVCALSDDQEIKCWGRYNMQNMSFSDII